MNILNLIPTEFMDVDDLEWPGRLYGKEYKNKYT